MADIHFYWKKVPETVPEHEQYVLYFCKDVELTYAVVTKKTFLGRWKEWRIRCIPLDIDCLIYAKNVKEAKRECEKRCLKETKKWIKKANQVLMALKKV